jgi:hypothetical protein
MKINKLNNIVTMKCQSLVFFTFLILFIAHFSISYSQTDSTREITGVITGSTISSPNNKIVSDGFGLNNQGTLILEKNLHNQYPTPNIIGNGTLELSGTTVQSISGQNIIQNLVVNNSSGILIEGNTRINGTVALSNGVVRLGNNNLILGSTASVTGTPSASKMFATDGSGQLRKEFSSAGSFIYPVGDVTGTPEYSPVTLNFTAGTFGSDNFAGVNLSDNKYPSGDITDNYLTRYWTLTQNNISNFTCNATFKYLVNDITGNESGISCVKVDPLPWAGFSPANTATHELTANGINGFSTFTGASIHSATLKLFLEGLYAGGSTMNQAYDETGPHFGAGIADQVTIELHNATNYSTIEYSSGLMNLSTIGDISISAIPKLYSGSYYLTIRHRNSITTTSALPVSFADANVNYNFTTAASKAFGNNLKNWNGLGVFVIYGGDVNLDGIVDSGDMNRVENESTAVTPGYIAEDVNGDGIVDTGDMNIVEKNSTAVIQVITP